MTTEFACGQILFNVRNSNLHYMVKETHLSTYITIRKKFIKQVDEINNVTEVNVKNNVDDQVRMENGLLKQEINELREEVKDLKTSCALFTVENEELEIKNEEFKKNIISSEDKIEEVYLECRHLKDTLEKANVDRNKLVKTIQQKENDNGYMEEVIRKEKKSSNKVEQSKLLLQENIAMLENNLETKELKILDLQKELIMKQEVNSSTCVTCEKTATTKKDLEYHERNEHSDEYAPTTSKCGTCDYQSDKESDLEVHMKTHMKHCCEFCGFEAELRSDLLKHKSFEHNFNCSECYETFASKDKLNKHICKHEIGNPSFEQFYTRSWMDANNCNKIYCNSIKQEVAILHCKKCAKSEKTCCWSPYNLNGEIDGVTHLEFELFTKDHIFKKMEIKWPELVKALK